MEKILNASFAQNHTFYIQPMSKYANQAMYLLELTQLIFSTILFYDASKKCLEFYFSKSIESIQMNFMVKVLNVSFAQNHKFYIQPKSKNAN